MLRSHYERACCASRAFCWDAYDFAGIEAAGLALCDIMPYRHVWATDILPQVLEFLALNFHIDLIHRDVLKRPIPRHSIVLHVAGPPCQTFAMCGPRGYWSDPRSRLYLQAIYVIEVNKPIVFLLENSHNLETIDGGRLVQTLLRRLEAA